VSVGRKAPPGLASVRGATFWSAPRCSGEDGFVRSRPEAPRANDGAGTVTDTMNTVQ